MISGLKKTGGINGEPKGVELDALTPDRILEIFVTSLKKYIDPNIYRGYVKQSYIQKVILDSLQDKINDITNEVINKELDNIKLNDFNVFDLAVNGYNDFPVQSLCSNNRDQNIKELVASYLK